MKLKCIQLIFRFGLLSKENIAHQYETSAQMAVDIVDRIRQSHARITQGFPKDRQLEVNVPQEMYAWKCFYFWESMSFAVICCLEELFTYIQAEAIDRT